MTAREPSAVEELADALCKRGETAGLMWGPLELSDATYDALANAALAAIRAMTPEQQAEVIGGVAETSLDFERERVVGPWREVQP